MRSTYVIGFVCAALSVFAEPPPSAKDILDSVRMIESRQQIDLQGQLRQDDIVIPFRLMQNGPLSDIHSQIRMKLLSCGLAKTAHDSSW